MLRTAIAFFVLSLASFSNVQFTFAEESTVEKIENKANEVIDDTKEGYRNAKDKGCEMINGKLECAGKKVKNKAKTLKDKTESKLEELGNKAD